MIAIRELFDNLNDIEATLASYRQNSQTLGSMSSKLALNSLKARRDELRLLLEEATQESVIDVCDYRVIPSVEGHYPAREVGLSLAKFQETLTAFFAAIKENKARAQRTSDVEMIQSSTLNFGYSYSGSLGVVLYTFNDELFSGWSSLDQAIQAIFELSADSDLEEVRRKADQYGKAAMRSFYEWSKNQTDSGMSLDIKWKRGDETKFKKTVQPQELATVQDIIQMVGDKKERTVTEEGLLVALNVTGGGYFKMVFADEEKAEISGTLDASFGRNVAHEVPHRYRATLNRSSRSSIYTDDEKVTWTLLELTELSA